MSSRPGAGSIDPASRASLPWVKRGVARLPGALAQPLPVGSFAPWTPVPGAPALARMRGSARGASGNRRSYRSRYGISYQIAFVRVLGRFPRQEPLEIDEEILRFAALQLGTSPDAIGAYAERRQTVSEHQRRIRTGLDPYLPLGAKFDPNPTVLDPHRRGRREDAQDRNL